MWERSPHARAYDVLSPAERKDPRCLACHSMVPTDVRVELLGIQCESCHGAGRHYSAEYVMRDDDLRARLGFERGDARTCARCHTDSSPSLIPFQYDEKLNAIRHWREKPAPASKGTGKQP
jgi:Cytochrome c7 and related cytochrome c